MRKNFDDINCLILWYLFKKQVIEMMFIKMFILSEFSTFGVVSKISYSWTEIFDIFILS